MERVDFMAIMLVSMMKGNAPITVIATVIWNVIQAVSW